MTTMQQESFQKQWSQIVAKAWADDQFKQRLLANPTAVLKEEGVTVPAGITFKIVENSDTVRFLTLPINSGDGEIAEADLAQMAGGIMVIAVSHSKTESNKR